MPMPDQQEMPGVVPPTNGGTPMPVMSSDQILGHVDSLYKGLPEPVRQALDHAHSLTGGGSSSVADVAKPDVAPAPVSPMATASAMPMPQLSTATAQQPGQPISESGMPPITAPLKGLSVSLPAMPAQPTRGDTELNRLRTTGPGVDQIHNPALHGLAKFGDIVGSIVAPKWSQFIPGTTLHNERLQANAAKEATEEQGASKSAADVAHTTAQTGLVNAQTENEPTHGRLESSQADEAGARAESLRHPIPKEEMEGKTVTTADGVMAWNPATKKYDQKVGDAPEDKGTITHFLDKSGNAWKLNHDGSATAITGPEGTQLQGTPTGPEGEKPLTNVEQLNKAMETRYQVLHPGGALPPQFTLPPNATQKDYDRLDKALAGTESALGTKSQRDAAEAAREQARALMAQNKTDKADTATKSAAFKAFTPALDSAERFNVMAKNYEDAAKGDQQAMLSLLANHIGMTMGLQKGARINQAMYAEAQHSLPWLQGVRAKFGDGGYLTGVTLSPEQMKQMVALGRERFAEDISKARNEATYMGSKDDGPNRTPNAATMRMYFIESGNDKARAKELAKQDGWTVN